VFKTGAAGYSLLLSSFGVGAIVGALATAQRGRFEGRGRALVAAFLTFAAVTLVAVTAGRQMVALLLLPVAGASLVSAFSTLNSLVQENAPAEMRGRILGIYGLAFRGGMPLGSLIAGALCTRAPVSLVIGSFCVGLALLAIGVYVRRPALRAL
jgi:predicted MFS family arabinose efflux permease